MSANAITLNIYQSAIARLHQWVNSSIPLPTLEPSPLLLKAQNILGYSQESTEFMVLRLLFDQVQLPKQPKQHKHPPKAHFWPPTALVNPGDGQTPPIPYPLEAPPNLDGLKADIRDGLEQLSPQDWQNSSLLSLFIEKFGSHLSYVGFSDRTIAYHDLVKLTAAIAVVLSQDPSADNLALIGADLSGIQTFIYTIASAGALKSLRARSFFLELVTEEIAQQLLQALKLSRANIIYNGGGKVYLLAAKTPNLAEVIQAVKDRFNQWFQKDYQSNIALSIDHQACPLESLGNPDFHRYWVALAKKLQLQKDQKFKSQLSDLLTIQKTHEPCKVCHRDDAPTLTPLKGNENTLACPTCCAFFELGDHLFEINALARSKRSMLKHSIAKPIKIFHESTVYYHPFRDRHLIPNQCDSVLLTNNWNLADYKSSEQQEVSLLMLGKYGQTVEPPDENERFMRAEEFTNNSQGIRRIGYLRMDVDRLGSIFSQGFDKQYSIFKLASLSRLLNTFFKVYLNSLAEDRRHNLSSGSRVLTRDNKRDNKRDLMFIYSGGDDLFVSGTWDQLVEFSLDLYQSFRAYTGHNPDVTLSAGIELSTAKFPLYQAAALAGKAEQIAKDQGRDRLCLFGQTFRWDEWLGTGSQEEDAIATGILPIMQYLNQALDRHYSRGFIQNLLQVAKTQEQWTATFLERKPTYTDEPDDAQTYLHLPAIAYMLSRFPKALRESENHRKLRQALLSAQNAKYYRAIATWISLLNRDTPKPVDQTNTDG